MRTRTLIQSLAQSLMAGTLDRPGAFSRAARTLGRRWRWLRPLTRRYVATFSGEARPGKRAVVAFVQKDLDWTAARAKYGNRISVAAWVPEPPQMQPVAVAAEWNVPRIETVADLADFLCLGVPELEWLADLKRLAQRSTEPKLQHYRYNIHVKRSGGARLIESPKGRLKHAQRRILSGILNHVPAHPCVHGFVRERSIVSFVAPHVHRPVLLRLDLQDFFPTFPTARVQAVFRTLGYPDGVANLLGGLCTNSVPRSAWDGLAHDIDRQAWAEGRQIYALRHLPQGAPTSPALANIMAYHLDARLAGLAATADAGYTRYADDLAFSGGEALAAGAGRFAAHAAAIAHEEGFRVQHRKTRVMRAGGRQQLAGVVVNEKLNVPRRDADVLKAILTNCVRHGPASQNRSGVANFRAHLEGRIGFVTMVNPDKGRKLRAIFDRIHWGESLIG